jgi:hypothetical protein
MNIKNGREQQESWNEYRLLVLAELERLDECVDKLRSQDITTVRECRQEITIIGKSLTTLARKIATLEQNGVSADHAERTKNSWALWAAIITIAAAMLTAIAGLVTSVISLRQSN